MVECLARFSAYCLLLCLISTLNSPAWSAPPEPNIVTTDSLLRQLTEIDQLPHLRSWTTLIQSSYDRSGGNNDFQNFLRWNGKTAVLAEMDGPGAVVRLWSANPNGQIKIYLDQSAVPLVNAPFAKLFDGSLLPFTAPLTQESSGGFYSYLPIPFARHCLITVDNPQGLYYQVESISYPHGAQVQTLQLPLPPAIQSALTRAGTEWNAAAPRPAVTTPFTLKASETATVYSQNSPGVVRQITLRVPGASPDMLRQLVLRGYFDGHSSPDIEAPVGDFFGNPFGPTPFSSRLLAIKSDGTLQAFFPMPFGHSARFTLENGSAAPLTIAFGTVFVSAPFNPKRDGYFHAYWSEEITQRGVPHLWAQVRGQQGHFVGIVQTIAGAHGLGFLEGDEQFRVDSQTWQPSQVSGTVIGPWNGTGTEDLFNSGWYFSRGPNALPLNGVLTRTDSGRIDAYRWFFTDAPVFQNSLDAQIEHGGANDAPGIYYSSVAYWYSAGESPARPNPIQSARLAAPHAPPVPTVPGAIEGEALVATAKASRGEVQVQEMGGFLGFWSNGEQLWWRGAAAGDKLTLMVPVSDSGTYDVIVYLTQASDYGQFSCTVHGQTLPIVVDAFHDGVAPSGPITLGRVRLHSGLNSFMFTVTGKNAKSAGTLFGLDCLQLAPQP